MVVLISSTILPVISSVPALNFTVTVVLLSQSSLGIKYVFSISEYETEALMLIGRLFKTMNPLILTGGSMLYVDTVCKGIDDIPNVSPEIRNEVIKWYEKNGLEALQQRLLEIDPEYYRIADLNNPKRLLHAVEIHQMTGKPFTSFRKNIIREQIGRASCRERVSSPV